MRFGVLVKPLQYHSKSPFEFLTKANNIMHTCCILHNLLLAYDHLDTLWTEEDCLSTWFAASATRARELLLYTYNSGTVIPTPTYILILTSIPTNTLQSLKSAQSSVGAYSANLSLEIVVLYAEE